MADVLNDAGIENAERESLWLLEASTDADDALRLARRRAAGEPLQYVTGTAGFRRLELAVGPGVFVPRPETEVVAGRALDLLPVGGTIVDVGTGCGAIALAVAHERSDARVAATEISRRALVWARRNADAIGLDIELYQGDLLEALPNELRGSVDVIVSNPPYVADSEASALPRDVVEHEPREALFAGVDGLEVIRRIVAESRAWLRPKGGLVVELSPPQAPKVTEIMERAGFHQVAVCHDLSGKARVAEGRR